MRYFRIDDSLWPAFSKALCPSCQDLGRRGFRARSPGDSGAHLPVARRAVSILGCSEAIRRV